MSSVIVVIGAGSIAQAIARRVSAGKHVLLADPRRGKYHNDSTRGVASIVHFLANVATVTISSRASTGFARCI
jgi:phosphoglycerate dehydrogenase-like enzyme